MLIALFADVHANREALTACLDNAEHEGAEMYVVLGDLVGNGTVPVWVVECDAELVANVAGTMQGDDGGSVDGEEQKVG